jgi:hypothetical protein
MNKNKVVPFYKRLHAKAEQLQKSSGLALADCSRLLYPQEEADTVQIIRKQLLTQEDRKLMFDLDISVEDILDGRVEGEEADEASKLIMKHWNERLGMNIFGFGVWGSEQ